MALVGTRVQAVADGDNLMALKTDVVVDPESGFVLKRKTLVSEVVSESGQHKAYVVGQQTSVAAVAPPRPQYQAAAIEPSVYTSDDDDNGRFLVHICCCLMSIIFPPCLVCWICYCCSK